MAITLSTNAVKWIKYYSLQEQITNGGLRISVTGGGCSGLSYKLDFQKEPTTGDKILEQDGVKLFIDPKSYLYIKGMQLDFSDGLNGTGFTFKNPNAAQSCGCGTSFSTK